MKDSSLLAILLFIFLPAVSAGTSCIHDDRLIAERSEKYQSEIVIDVLKSGTELDVSVEFPRTIEGEEFAKIVVYSASDGMISFMAPLLAGNNREKLRTWFVVGAELASNTVIQISYGPACGLHVEYELPYVEVSD